MLCKPRNLHVLCILHTSKSVCYIRTGGHVPRHTCSNAISPDLPRYSRAPVVRSLRLAPYIPAPTSPRMSLVRERARGLSAGVSRGASARGACARTRVSACARALRCVCVAAVNVPLRTCVRAIGTVHTRQRVTAHALARARARGALAHVCPLHQRVAYAPACDGERGAAGPPEPGVRALARACAPRAGSAARAHLSVLHYDTHSARARCACSSGIGSDPPL